MTFASLANKTSERMLFVAGIGLFVLAPYFLARIIFQFAQLHFPTWAQLVIVGVFFALLLLGSSTANRGPHTIAR
jgi:hypothetical protein